MPKYDPTANTELIRHHTYLRVPLTEALTFGVMATVWIVHQSHTKTGGSGWPSYLV